MENVRMRTCKLLTSQAEGEEEKWLLPVPPPLVKVPEDAHPLAHILKLVNKSLSYTTQVLFKVVMCWVSDLSTQHTGHQALRVKPRWSPKPDIIGHRLSGAGPQDWMCLMWGLLPPTCGLGRGKRLGPKQVCLFHPSWCGLLHVIRYGSSVLPGLMVFSQWVALRVVGASMCMWRRWSQEPPILPSQNPPLCF